MPQPLPLPAPPSLRPHEAFETVLPSAGLPSAGLPSAGDTDPAPPGPGAWLLTCEHASRRIPRPLRSTAADRPWLATHWGYDIGARAVVRTLARRWAAPAVLARFSRLVVDANREPDHPDLVRGEVEGHALSFNRGLTGAEVGRRLATLHAPYHAEVDRLLAQLRAAGRAPLLLSVHSFTPAWEGRARPMEVGVLFDEHDDLAEEAARRLEAEGFVTARNAPYSGKAGLIYAPQRHGRMHAVPYLELELNQALIAAPAAARAVAVRVARALGPLSGCAPCTRPG